MSWSETQVLAILEEMRAGATVQTGGSRCHTTYFHQDGEWRYEVFDEGHTSVGPTGEGFVRGLIAREPELFRNVLAAPRRRRFSAAFLAGEREAAREALRSLLEYGDPDGSGELLDAMLAWPEVAPSAAIVERLRRAVTGLTAYHLFMGAAGWDRSPPVGEKGVRFAEQLRAMVGEPLGIHYLRSAFHEQAGDLTAAERDMQEELMHLPAGDWHHETFQERVLRLRRRMGLSP
jgi:hypothetical protein